MRTFYSENVTVALKLTSKSFKNKQQFFYSTKRYYCFHLDKDIHVPRIWLLTLVLCLFNINMKIGVAGIQTVDNRNWLLPVDLPWKILTDL